MTTTKKILANRANARRSPGPQTPRGKNNSRRNATKHGFYSPELILFDEDKQEFEELRRGIHTQFQPKTALQIMTLEDVVCCRWRCKLALRLEMRRLGRLSDMPHDLGVQPEEGTPGPTNTARWYASDRPTLHSAIRWLRDVRDDFEENGEVRDAWKENMDNIFGPEFYRSLKKWTPMSRSVILMVNQIVAHRKMHGTGGTIPVVDDTPELTIDPNQGHEMVGKLVGQELRHLEDMHRSWELVVSESVRAETAAVDFTPRYFTNAVRDFRAAVEFFEYLKANNL